MKKLIASGFVFLFLIFAFASGNVIAPEGGPESTVTPNNEHQMAPAASYTPHGPITISSNADFSGQGWPGNGLPGDPYIIEGLNITVDAVCINITSTTVYFEIRNCLISSEVTSSYDGILLNHARYGTIRDCILEHHNNGVSLIESYYNALINNTVSSNYDCGFYLDDAFGCILSNNTASNNRDGFYIHNAGYSIITNNTASDNSNGFLLQSGSCTFTNNTSFNNMVGVSVRSYNSTLSNNTVSSNLQIGISLSSSSDCVITNNTLVDNGVIIFGTSLSYYLNDFAGNIVNNKPIGYFLNLTSSTIDGSQYGQVILAYCTDVLVRDGVFNNVSQGIQMYYSIDCTLLNNTVLNNTIGIRLRTSLNCTLIDNIASDNLIEGFSLNDSDNCTLTSNTASQGSNGFTLRYSSFCEMTNNTATDNDKGFILEEMNNLTFTDNSATNHQFGIYLYNSNNSTLTSNTAANNNDGFFIYNSEDCKLIAKTASGNSYYGIR